MSIEVKKNKDKDKDIDKKSKKKDNLQEVCDNIDNIYDKKCSHNRELLKSEEENRTDLAASASVKDDILLYPHLDDPNFIMKIALKKEFNDTKYDGTIYSVKDFAEILSKAEYELLPHQAFVRNFMSFQTPYNSLLLFHGLGSGKTCSAIGVCEEMRDYLKQMGISKQIIIVASPNVQDNFKLQLFDERKLKEVDGIWTTKGCLGNKLLKEINPTGMRGLTKEKVIQQVKSLINMSYYFVGYLQFSNDIVRKSGNPELSTESKIRNLQNEYNDNLIVIDEVHNIRISDDNENKTVAKNLMYLVSVVKNLRLLLLSATPMFNNYKEIVWLLNLMNMNDKRGIISVSDIFDNDGNFKEAVNGISGKDVLIRKATGYISYVRGENPYTFPFRVYPNKFAPNLTFKSKEEYPQYQINGKKIPDDRKIEKLSICLTAIGEYQELGYKYIIDRLMARQEGTKQTKTGKIRKTPSFKSQQSFGYIDLQVPLGALNIVYPLEPGLLESLTADISNIEFDEEYEADLVDLSPMQKEGDIDVVAEIDDVITNGPKLEHSIKSDIRASASASANSELESEPAVTEGLDGDMQLIDQVVEIDTSKISSNKPGTNESSTVVPGVNESSTVVPGVNESSTVVPGVNESSTVAPLGLTEKKGKQLTKTTFSKSIVQKPVIQVSTLTKKKVKGKETEHIVEGDTVSQMPSKKNDTPTTTLEASLNKGGQPTPKQKLYVNPKELTGSDGLRRIMEYTDEKTPAIKGDFEYRKNVPHMFNPNEIGKYSAKIKHICECIYNSAYLDAGLIPMA